jgi:HK97 family phage prohead protease
MLNRAYALLEIKQVDQDARTITGMASTPTPDRLEDVVEPDGAQFKLPLPLLWQHDSGNPIGQVTHAKVSKAGIEIVARIAKGVTDEIDRAWALIKAGLVPGLSIGFKAIEHEFITETKGIRFIKWDWLELSAVTIPANQQATIATIKSIDTAQRAASGQAKPRRVVHLNPPGASGSSQPKSVAQEGAMKTIAEQITALESKRSASAARMEAVMQKGLDEDRTSDAGEQDEFDNLSSEVEALDKDLVRLRKIEQAKAFAAKAVKGERTDDGVAARSGIISVKAPPKLQPGIGFAQRLRCEILSHRQYRPAGDIATELYGPDSPVTLELTQKANVVAGSTISGNWAANLVSLEGGTAQDFIEWLRPQTILGRFGQGGVPSLRNVMFNVPMIAQTAGGAAWWTGEGKAKPLTAFAFTRTTLAPLKVATICVLTMESVRFSSPKSDTIVRDQLGAAVRERIDIDFITPSKAAVAGISPASITNGAATIVSSGDDADAIRVDIRSLIAKYTAANNPPTSGVFIMGSTTAGGLASLTNPLGQPEFASMSFTGGTLFGYPVIVSDYVPAGIVALVNASDIYLADDGEVSVDSSTEASLEMTDAPTGSSITPTATSLVSMYQTNSIAVRAERVLNWARRRTQSVAYLTSADWGGPVHTA